MDKETHPFLELDKINGTTKLILDSFPVFGITNPDSEEKQKIRTSDGTVRFFYGSCKSSFWSLYHLHIDRSLIIPINVDKAIESLKNNSIAMLDIIKSCERKGMSALDSDLKKREYNSGMIEDFIKNGGIKILCTSKGVMELLHEKVMFQMKDVKYLKSETSSLQVKIINELGGEINQIKKGICRVYNLNGKHIQILSIPSPGSPQRQLKQFGFNGDDWRVYADLYFEFSFKWLTL